MLDLTPACFHDVCLDPAEREQLESLCGALATLRATLG